MIKCRILHDSKGYPEHQNIDYNDLTNNCNRLAFATIDHNCVIPMPQYRRNLCLSITQDKDMMTSNTLKNQLSQSISVKLLVIFFLILLIQWPLSYVRSLIQERQSLQYQAKNSIAKRWGSAQYLGTPLLQIRGPQQVKTVDESSERFVTTTHLQSLASTETQLSIDLSAQKRYLGIYEAAVFQAQVHLSGYIDIPEQTVSSQPKTWSLFVPIKQLKGLKRLTKVTINGQRHPLRPNQGSHQDLTGLSLDLHAFRDVKRIEYVIELTLAGSEQFDVMPLAKHTSVSMQSNWPSPSFIGHYLPDDRHINEQGFKAQWQVNRLLDTVQSSQSNTTTLNHDQYYPKPASINHNGFGVKIMIAANVYQVNERSIKYSFLIVLLTFAAFFLAELFFELKLHPFHYLMVGMALSVFYLLLLSLSEFLRFNLAYLAASAATTLMIGSYCSAVLKQRQRGLVTAMFFAILYGFIYVLVRAEQSSLLMGSIAIWLVLSAVMYLTRKIDWYSINVRHENADKSL